MEAQPREPVPTDLVADEPGEGQQPVLRGGRVGRHLAGAVAHRLFDALEVGDDQVLLAGEVPVGGRPGHRGLGDHPVHADRPQPLGVEQHGRRPQQSLPGPRLSALQMVARTRRRTISDAGVTAEVGIGPDGAGGSGLEITLHVELGGLDQAAAEALVEKAHQVCPYSNATRGNVPVTLETTVA